MVVPAPRPDRSGRAPRGSRRARSSARARSGAILASLSPDPDPGDLTFVAWMLRRVCLKQAVV
eukprot:12590500-Alexandrium_andersonii.AAC.1